MSKRQYFIFKVRTTSYSTFLILFILSFCCLMGCNTLESTVPPEEIENNDFDQLDPFEQQIVTYFNDIALGFEFGNASKVTRKWVDEISIRTEGILPDALNSELDIIINEINALASDGLKLKRTEDINSNFRIFFGSGDDYAVTYPGAKNHVANNRGLFFVKWDQNQNIYVGDMYVDIISIPEVFQKHLLREELTQSLGLAMDNSRYPESIFQVSWTDVTDFAPIDKELIRLLYHPKMVSGMNERQSTEVLIDILINE